VNSIGPTFGALWLAQPIKNATTNRSGRVAGVQRVRNLAFLSARNTVFNGTPVERTRISANRLDAAQFLQRWFPGAELGSGIAPDASISSKHMPSLSLTALTVGLSDGQNIAFMNDQVFSISESTCGRENGSAGG
jgi:hypothetical protein